jgi:hypothetical protein
MIEGESLKEVDGLRQMGLLGRDECWKAALQNSMGVEVGSNRDTHQIVKFQLKSPPSDQIAGTVLWHPSPENKAQQRGNSSTCNH